MKARLLLLPVEAILLLLVLAWGPPRAAADSWASWRGIDSDGVSADTGLPSSWSPDGENLLWQAPYGGRSAPIVVDGRVCMIRLAEPDHVERWQEQIACLDADTGELVWEHRYNVFQTDIPHHRVGWASLVGDPATGNVYAHGVEGMIIAFDPHGKILWERFHFRGDREDLWIRRTDRHSDSRRQFAGGELPVGRLGLHLHPAPPFLRA